MSRDVLGPMSYLGIGANGVWLAALEDLVTGAPIQEGRDQKTKEILHAVFRLSNPRERYLTVRTINPAFAIAEVIWILSGSNDLDEIAWWNNRMRQFSDDGEILRGAYGNRISNTKFGNQLYMAYDAFKDNPDRRDVVIQVWDKDLDLPFSETPRSKDIPCNVMAHPMIRGGKLEWLQVMRSNDLIWGTPYNFIQWTTIQEIMAGWLGIDVGNYVHLSDSLHIYERHWDYAKEIMKEALQGKYRYSGVVDDLRLPLDEWQGVFERVYVAYLKFARSINSADIEDTLSADVPEAYKNWLLVLAAEVARKLDMFILAYEYADRITHPALQTSMRQWLNHKAVKRGNES